MAEQERAELGARKAAVLRAVVEEVVRSGGLPEDSVGSAARRVTEAVADRPLRAAAGRAAQLAGDARPAEAGLFSMVADAVRDMEEHDDAERVLVGGVANLTGELALWRAESLARLFHAPEHGADVPRLLRAASLQDEPSVLVAAQDPGLRPG